MAQMRLNNSLQTLKNTCRGFLTAVIVSAALSGPVFGESPNSSDFTQGQDWAMLDWETRQRIMRLTSDELPLIAKKADQGDVYSMTLVGLAYRDGVDRASVGSAASGTIRSGTNNTEALAWLNRAAQAGFPMAMVELGEMHYQGHGVQRDMEKAIEWTRRAHEASDYNYPRAALNLAQMELVANPSADNIALMVQNAAKQAFKALDEASRSPAPAALRIAK